MEKTDNTPWIRWSERTPEDGMFIIIIQHPVNKALGLEYGFRYFGTYPHSLVICKEFINEIDSFYWIELPK